MYQVVVGRDQKDSEIFGSAGTINIGKFIAGKGDDAQLTTDVFMDILRPHSMLVCGKRGGGKSYTLGVMAEAISETDPEISKRLSVLMIDTQGIFWTMKQPNEKDEELLEDMGLKAKGYDAKVYVPHGQAQTLRDAGIIFDGVFSISPAELSAYDWMGLFNVDINDPIGIILQNVLREMSGDFTIEDIIEKVRGFEGFEKDKMALENLLYGTKAWGIFGESKMPDILVPEKISIMDVSMTPQVVRELLVSIACKKIFYERVKARRKEEMGSYEETKPMCWLFIDEAHNFVPADGKALSFEIMLRIVKEGRQPGVSTVFATQQPFKVHPDVLSQCDLILAHRLTSKEDIAALSSIMQTYAFFGIEHYISELPRLKGVGIILDDNSERVYRLRVRPRKSWHSGESPVASSK